MMQLNLHDIGADMYSSSPHKWLMAPKGSGYLYVRDEVIDRVRAASRHLARPVAVLQDLQGPKIWTGPL